MLYLLYTNRRLLLAALISLIVISPSLTEWKQEYSRFMHIVKNAAIEDHKTCDLVITGAQSYSSLSPFDTLRLVIVIPTELF